MKRVKIMLTALAVLTVVGGALAFKAKKVGQYTLYCTNAADKSCPTPSINVRLTLTDDDINGTATFCSDAPHTGNDCPATFITDTE